MGINSVVNDGPADAAHVQRQQHMPVEATSCTHIADQNAVIDSESQEILWIIGVSFHKGVEDGQRDGQ